MQVALDAEGLPKYISLDWDTPQDNSAPQESEEQALPEAASAGQVSCLVVWACPGSISHGEAYSFNTLAPDPQGAAIVSACSPALPAQPLICTWGVLARHELGHAVTSDGDNSMSAAVWGHNPPGAIFQAAPTYMSTFPAHCCMQLIVLACPVMHGKYTAYISS